MKKKYLILFLGVLSMCTSWAVEPLKKPLCFVASDSMVVWGEDRSDLRTTALTVAPQLTVRPTRISIIDKKGFKKQLKQWEKETVPALNMLGGIFDEFSKIQVVPTTAVIKDAATLFLQTGNAKFMDVIERSSLNALMSVLSPGELTFDKHIAAQALMNVSGMVYATDEQGIYVNLYVNNSTHVKSSNWDFIIEQLTAMPHSNRVKLRISGLKKGLQPIVMRLRMPDWALQRRDDNAKFLMEGTPKQVPTVYVNGREEFYWMENGFLVIDRKWNSGDEVFFDLPFDIQQISPEQKGTARVVALQRGPLVYGFRQPTDGLFYSKDRKIEELPEPNRFGHSVLGVPVKRLNDDSLLLKAEPVMDGTNYLWLNVRN